MHNIKNGNRDQMDMSSD
jgi:hypothetical protein